MLGLLVRRPKKGRVRFLNTNHGVKICEILAWLARFVLNFLYLAKIFPGPLKVF